MTARAIVIACLVLLLQPHAHAQETNANEASIRELLLVTDAKQLLDRMWVQMDLIMENSMKQALSGQPVTPAQQVVLDDMRKQMGALLKEELAWEVFEPLMIDVYLNTFTEEEVQGMLQFYKSPAGRAVVTKMPAVMQASMQAVQGPIAAMQPKLRKLQEDTVRKLMEAK